MRFIWWLSGQLPAGWRHALLLALSAALTAVTQAVAAGKAPGEVLLAAWIAILAVVTPLVQSYGARGGSPDDDDR